VLQLSLYKLLILPAQLHAYGLYCLQRKAYIRKQRQVSASVLTNPQLAAVPHFADEDKQLIMQWPHFMCLAGRPNQKCTTRLFNSHGLFFYVNAKSCRPVYFFVRTHACTSFMNTGLNIIKCDSSETESSQCFPKNIPDFENSLCILHDSSIST